MVYTLPMRFQSQKKFVRRPMPVPPLPSDCADEKKEKKGNESSMQSESFLKNRAKKNSNNAVRKRPKNPVA